MVSEDHTKYHNDLYIHAINMGILIKVKREMSWDNDPESDYACEATKRV